MPATIVVAAVVVTVHNQSIFLSILFGVVKYCQPVPIVQFPVVSAGASSLPRVEVICAFFPRVAEPTSKPTVGLVVPIPSL